MRLGELVGLCWADVDLNGQFIEVRRSVSGGEETSPKNGKSRRVDMSNLLKTELQNLRAERNREKLKNGWKELPPWVFCTLQGNRLDPDNLRHRVFYRLLTKAGIRRIRFHDLRHTFASLLFEGGQSPAYVRDQLGHSSIQVTVDIYGHLVPGANRKAMDGLANAITRNPRATKGKEEKPEEAVSA
jgi:integrase